MKRVLPHGVEPSTTDGDRLATVDGVTAWAAKETLLLENGASVPGGTAIGTLIFEKAV